MGLNVIRGVKRKEEKKKEKKKKEKKKSPEWLIDHYYMELFSASDQNHCAQIVYDYE